MTLGGPVSSSINYRLAESADGVAIAVSIEGTGEPIVYMPSIPWMTMQMRNPIAECVKDADPSRAIGWSRRLVRYDVRGTGLSGGELDFSLDAQALDLQAALDAAGSGSVVLFVPGHSGPVGLRFAAEHPERVSALILWGAYATGSDYSGAQIRALRAMFSADWSLYTEILSLQFMGWDQPDASAKLAELVAAEEPEGRVRARVQEQLRVLAQADVSGLLPEIGVPTLVLGRHGPYMGSEVAESLARSITGAQLAFVDASVLSPLIGDSDDLCSTIDQFMARHAEG